MLSTRGLASQMAVSALKTFFGMDTVFIFLNLKEIVKSKLKFDFNFSLLVFKFLAAFYLF